MKQPVRFKETWRFYHRGDIEEVEPQVAEELVRHDIAEKIGLPRKAIAEETPVRLDKMVRAPEVPNKALHHQFSRKQGRH